jgi:hypothetical protein
LAKTKRALNTLFERDAVEADTRTFVTDILVDALGYDKYDELTAEYLVRGEFADIGARVAGELRFFVEIKRITMPLKDQHLRQVKTYAANEGVPWVILTNGREWQLYHISSTTPIVHLLVSKIDLMDAKPAQAVEFFLPFSRPAITRPMLNKLWQDSKGLHPETVSGALRSEAVLSALRRQIRSQTGSLVDADKLSGQVDELLGFSKNKKS